MQNASQQVKQRIMTVPLTKDTVMDYWKQMLAIKGKEMPRIESALKEARVELNDNLVVVHTVNAYLKEEVRPFATSMMEWLRHESGNENLMLKLEIEHIEVEVKPYSSNDKYEAMVKENAMLADLRNLLTEIDL